MTATTRSITRKDKSATLFARPANESSRPIPQVRPLGGCGRPVCGLLPGFVSLGRGLRRKDRRGSLSCALLTRSRGGGGIASGREGTAPSQHAPDARGGPGIGLCRFRIGDYLADSRRFLSCQLFDFLGELAGLLLQLRAPIPCNPALGRA